MPLNLIKKYDEFLDIDHLNVHQREKSLRLVFNRDFHNGDIINFRTKKINPVSGADSAIDTLYTHLTTHVTDKKTNKREFERSRSIRLHWVRFHIEEKAPDMLVVFSVEDGDEIRTYIYDKTHRYVIILSPFRHKQEYYLLTAYHLEGRNVKKIENKIKRKLPHVY